jgi:hypothetical protein
MANRRCDFGKRSTIKGILRRLTPSLLQAIRLIGPGVTCPAKLTHEKLEAPAL